MENRARQRPFGCFCPVKGTQGWLSGFWMNEKLNEPIFGIVLLRKLGRILTFIEW
jgi:hypothetical protein